MDHDQPPPPYPAEFAQFTQMKPVGDAGAYAHMDPAIYTVHYQPQYQTQQLTTLNPVITQYVHCPPTVSHIHAYFVYSKHVRRSPPRRPRPTAIASRPTAHRI